MLASPDFYQNSVAYFNIESRRLSATDTVLGFTGIAAVCRSKSNLQFATYNLFGSGVTAVRAYDAVQVAEAKATRAVSDGQGCCRCEVVGTQRQFLRAVPP
jgi:hypothetical protein